jgi:hypothetical protein
MSKPKGPSGVALAFLIEGAEDEFQEDNPWPTTQRAAAEAILARYALTPRKGLVGGMTRSTLKRLVLEASGLEWDRAEAVADHIIANGAKAREEHA